MTDSILVTGSYGFVGQWLVKKLIEKNYNIIAIKHENDIILHEWNKKNVIVKTGDICDIDFIKNIFIKYNPKIVFHLAAQALVKEALEYPLETIETNALGTTVILDCARKYGNCKKIIIASSDKAYGNEPSPYDENTQLAGRYPYDCSKSCTDLIAQSYTQTYKMPISILRCGNIFGGGDLNWSRVFPEAITSCYEKRPMCIRSDGVSMLRDYIYVEDVISAYIFISELENNEIVNVSYEKPRSVLDILSCIQEKTNTKIDPNIKNTAKCEIDIQFLNSNHIRSLGWKPEFDFEKGVNKTIDWYYDYFRKGNKI